MSLLLFIAFITFVFSIFSMASFSAHSAVYFIILTFLSSGLIYYIVGSTYVSIILFIVYVGAVAMLFIFCVMLLNLKNNLSVNSFRYYAYLPFIFFAFLGALYAYSYFFQINVVLSYLDWPTFNYSFHSKDYMFLSTFFTLNSFYIMLIGILLFFVTVAVTAILS